MKSPEDCSNMQEIRAAIDSIDEEVVQLLGKRFAYVKAAAKFKTSEKDVQAPERFRAMLQQRRQWAEAAGLSPDAIEKMYTDLVKHFIEEEMKHWQSR
ncbi:isochorismate lyase [Chitinophaga arvensicola]|uniref:chorismate mutase n=1 Tax=Chitinophaga arvensicola TaxID=29529 RepID=A0A1I0S9E1_9BACT|nr:isochorismate lyase [Chitinophaga arvensicola]SEW51642.1 isochorismate pyruvate lyase [Chitinophaga arvensicola]